MKNQAIKELLGDTDIYLVDQIMKNRYPLHHKILDAGCGGGRNLHWFATNSMDITAVDTNRECIDALKIIYSYLSPTQFLTAPVEKMPFAGNYFDHIISSAVLHFATTTQHFMAMMAEMIRVLKPGGSLFIRMAADMGIEDKILPVDEGVYSLPDGTERFLLTRQLLHAVMKKFHLSFLEPFKTVNVSDYRCMSVWVVQKN
jgi:tellurite methyltransferase